MRNREEQSRSVDRLFERQQIIGHAQCLRGSHARVAPGEYIFHFAQQKFLKGLSDVCRPRQGQILLGESAKSLGHSRLFRQPASVPVQVFCFAVGQRRAFARPHQIVVFEQRRIDVVKVFQLIEHQRRVRQHVHAPAAHFVEGLRAFAGVEQLDLDPQILGHLLQQVGTGADQMFGVLRVLPQVRRRVRATGDDQALALAGSRSHPRQQDQSQ